MFACLFVCLNHLHPYHEKASVAFYRFLNESTTAFRNCPFISKQIWVKFEQSLEKFGQNLGKILMKTFEILMKFWYRKFSMKNFEENFRSKFRWRPFLFFRDHDNPMWKKGTILVKTFFYLYFRDHLGRFLPPPKLFCSPMAMFNITFIYNHCDIVLFFHFILAWFLISASRKRSNWIN